MKREKFLEDAKAEPSRIYRTPNDVLRDRRLTDDHRREILAAWERQLSEAPDGDQTELIAAVRRALDELADEGRNPVARNG